MRGGCVVVDPPAPSWTVVDSAKSIYTELSFDGSTLCAVDTSYNFICASPATSPLAWSTYKTNIKSGFVGGSNAAVVDRSGGPNFYYTTSFAPGASYTARNFGGTPLSVLGDKDTICVTDTLGAVCLTGPKIWYVDAPRVDVAVSGDVVYSINAAGALFKGARATFRQGTETWVQVAGAPTLGEISVGDGRLCGIVKADKTVVCSTNDVNWTTLPDANWAHVAVFGSTIYASDSTNKLSSYTFQ